MKKIKLLFIFIISFLWSFSLTAQIEEEVGAGVIEFLLSNPKTANRMNATDEAALNILGKLLRTQSNRKHELNVANTGKTQMVIQGENGSNATLVQDNSGNVYLLSNGTIYPLAQSLVNQAKEQNYTMQEVSSSNLPAYNINMLSQQFNSNNISTERKSVVLNKMMNHYEILANLEPNARIVDYQWAKNTFMYKPEFRGNREKFFAKDRKAYLPKTATVFYEIEKTSTKLNCIFTCNWAKDLDGDGVSFDEFFGIKRNFASSEKINLVIKSNLAQRDEVILELNFLNAFSGEQLFDKSLFINSSITLLPLDFINAAGTYVVVAKIKDKYSKSIIDSSKERFEIND